VVCTFGLIRDVTVSQGKRHVSVYNVHNIYSSAYVYACMHTAEHLQLHVHLCLLMHIISSSEECAAAPREAQQAHHTRNIYRRCII
jgi:hypothetical protein